MPNKRARNAFYFYMMDFKQQQRKEGIEYGNLADVAEAAGQLWKDAPPHIRTKFQEKANKEKALRKTYTSTGVSLEEIERREQALKDAEEAERQDIRNIVKLKYLNDAIIQEDFYIMDVNYYCKAGRYLIAESTVLRFNLRDGILDYYHEMIHPGKIPVGYGYDVKLGSHDIGLDIPDETQSKSNYLQILANIFDYLKRQDRNAKTLPPIFTMPDKVAPVQDFIAQMCSIAEEDYGAFRVYKLDGLFFTLVNALASCLDEGFPRESLALTQLKRDPFKYNPGLACEVHEARDKATKCSRSRAKRWAYTVLDSCCPLRGIEMLPRHHVPDDFSMDGIIVQKSSGKLIGGPCFPGPPLTSRNTSSAPRESFNDTVNMSMQSTSRKQQRIHVPLRKPKMDYSQTIRTEPEFTEPNFSSLSAGRGTSSGQKRIHVPLRLPKTDYSQTIRTEPEFTEPNFSSLSAGRGTSSGQKRIHVPLRLPKTDYSQAIGPAPEFTKLNFLPLSAGRGRGLSILFSKMNIQQ